MSDRFPHLFSPLELRGVTLRNRIVSTAHGTYMSSTGLPNERIAAYHEARARGGAGLIICEAASIHETAIGASRYAVAHTDACIEPYAQIVSRVRTHGASVFGQLYHPGRGDIAGSSDDGTISIAYAPSPVPCERNQLMPRPMSSRLVKEVVTAYGDAAARMVVAGLQGIEVMAHHGHLVSQFLNPRVNQRIDEYGGSFSNRLRFLAEILEEVRARIGAEAPLGVRICGDEMDELGLRPDESLEVCEAIEHTGRVDYFSVNLGSSSSLRGGMHSIAPMAMPAGYIGPYAAAIKRHVTVPVLATGRINTPDVAEALLAAGDADLCGMTRAQICDPELANKAREDRSEDIRVCIACNQACIGHGGKGAAISCIQYPESGRELLFPVRPRTAHARRVLVAGGGPAGLKAAAVAATGGHTVALYEAAERLGGQVLVAERLPGRAEFGRLATHLEREARAAGVDIRTGETVTRTLIERNAPDALIIATGAGDYRPALDDDSDIHCISAMQVAREEANVGERVVIADSELGWTALGVAEQLAARGCSVRLAVIGDVPGQHVPYAVRNHALGRLHELGVEIQPHLELMACREDRAEFIHVCSGAAVKLDDVDTLVVAAGRIQQSTLEESLDDYPGVVRLAGDCLAPRTAEEAVLEGLKAGYRLFV